METFIDPFNFKPLDPAHDECLLHACELAKNVPGENDHDFTFSGDGLIYKELKDMGYLTFVTVAMGGNGIGGVSSKGLRYPDDKAAWEKRYNAWEEERESERELEAKRVDAERAADRRHDWRLNIVNGVYAIVAGIVSLAFGFLLGKL